MRVTLLLFAAALITGTTPHLLRGPRAAAHLLANSTIADVVEGIRDGRFSCEDVIREQLRRIDEYNPRLKAFISVNRKQVIKEARRKDRAGVRFGRLHCVPVAVKDNMDLVGLPTTSGAVALQSMVAVEDSAIVARIKELGGIIIGKTNMAEMSDSGTKSESTLGGVCANPWDNRRSCLGSSGGSAAAVAAGLAVVAMGTDTEGSVIGPCTASGLLCLRPTQGPPFEPIRRGVYPAFERQDMVGIMAKTAADYLTAHDAIYGADLSRTSGRVTQLSNLKIRFLDNFYETIPIMPGVTYTPDPQMVRAHNVAAQRLASLGAQVDRYKVDLAELGPKLQAIFVATSTKPACSNSCMKKSLDTYFTSYAATGPFRKARDLLSVISGFPASYQAKLRFTLAQADADVCSSAACSAYDAGRAAVTAVMRDLIGDADALAVPFTAKLPHLHSEEPGLADQISPALNPYTGWPSLSLPVGFSNSTGREQPLGLPVSLVLVSRANQEQLLLSIASSYLNRFADPRRPKL